MDEKVSKNVSISNIEINQPLHTRGKHSLVNKNILMEKIEKTIEETFSESYFEWVKTEREGEISMFKHFLTENDIEYVVFQDATRIRKDLIGDVVMMHSHESEFLNTKQAITPPLNDSLQQPESFLISKPLQPVKTLNTHVSQEIDPVTAILDKSKKKNEKVTLTLNLKIPSLELYNVIKENFENAEDVLLQNVMDQIHDNLLRESLRRELQNIYQKRKRNPQ